MIDLYGVLLIPGWHNATKKYPVEGDGDVCCGGPAGGSGGRTGYLLGRYLLRYFRKGTSNIILTHWGTHRCFNFSLSPAFWRPTLDFLKYFHICQLFLAALAHPIDFFKSLVQLVCNCVGDLCFCFPTNDDIPCYIHNNIALLLKSGNMKIGKILCCYKIRKTCYIYYVGRSSFMIFIIRYSKMVFFYHFTDLILLFCIKTNRHNMGLWLKFSNMYTCNKLVWCIRKKRK